MPPPFDFPFSYRFPKSVNSNEVYTFDLSTLLLVIIDQILFLLVSLKNVNLNLAKSCYFFIRPLNNRDIVCNRRAHFNNKRSLLR